MEYRDIHRIARRKVRYKKWFHRHFAVFFSVMIFSIITLIPGRNLWMIYRELNDTPILLWGALVLLHYLLVYGFPLSGALSQKWEEKQLKKELNKLYTSQPIDSEDYQRLAFEDRLELQELNRLKEKWDGDHFV